MSRPLDPENTDSLALSLRITRPLADALDAELARFTAANPGVSASRATIARIALMRAFLPTGATLASASAPAPLVAGPSPAPPPEAPAVAVAPVEPAPVARPKRAPRVVPAPSKPAGVRVETTPENNELRARYIAAVNAGSLTHRGTAERAGCSDKMLRMWASGKRRNLGAPLLSKIRRELKAHAPA